MKIGIMQPYLFPYIGYFQLMNLVDKYVVYDNASFANNKWGFRNRILINGAPGYFRINILKASQNKGFNEIRINNDIEAKKKNIQTLEHSYKKAPHFSEVMSVLEPFLMAEYDNLAEYNVASNRLICDYLGIKTEILLFSELDYDEEQKRQYRIFDVCRILGGDEYINAIVKYGHWKDTGIRIRGSAVAGFTSLFLQMWNGITETDSPNDCRKLMEASKPASISTRSK